MITRLDSQVWAQDRCTGCGMCVAACSKQVLQWGDRHPVLRTITKSIGISKFDLDTCSFCNKFCEEVCPALEPAARRPALVQVSARAMGPLGGGEPNDVARNLLIAARGSGMIDGALVMDADRAGHTRARIVTSAGEIAETAGFQYTWTPLLGALNQAVFDLGLKNLAIVGTPCTAQAVRRVVDGKDPRLAPYRRAVRLTVAMFCMGVYQPEELTQFLAEEMRVAPEQVARISISPRENKWRAELWDGSVRQADGLQARPFTRAGCARCDDYTGESADLAIGTVGASQGYATVVMRSAAGQAAVHNAVSMRLLETVDDVDEGALWRATAEKDRRERAQEFDHLTVLMLEALGEPLKRAQLKQQLDLLYGRPLPMSRKEEYRNAGCGDCSGC